MDRRLKLRQILRRLGRAYGRRDRRRRERGLDVLVEAMLAQNTNMLNATRGYRMLRRALPTWTKVMTAPIEVVQRQIAICGLARMRARRLQDLLRTIKTRHGRLSLEFLGQMPHDEAFAYLLGFHGVGPKTAAFVLLFAFDHPVLPVDNGVLRVVRRLRLVRPKARDLEAERVLSPLITRGRHYPMHLLLFHHAKATCRPRNPKCHDCPLLTLCPYGQRRVKHHPPPRDTLPPRPLVLSKFASAGIRKRHEPE